MSAATTASAPARFCGLSWPLPEQVFLLAAQHQLVLLVVDRHRDRHHPRRALRQEARHRQHRIERVAGIDRLQEFRRLLDKGDQRVADHMREIAGPGGGKAQHLEAVSEQPVMTLRPAILDVVMDRVVVARDSLKRGEIGLGDGTARNVEGLADGQIVEIAALREPVRAVVEALGHRSPTIPSAASAAIRFSASPSPARTARVCSPTCGAGDSARSASAETPGVRGTLKAGMSRGSTATAPPVATICGSPSQSSKPLTLSARMSAARSLSSTAAIPCPAISRRMVSNSGTAFSARLAKLA